MAAAAGRRVGGPGQGVRRCGVRLRAVAPPASAGALAVGGAPLQLEGPGGGAVRVFGVEHLGVDAAAARAVLSAEAPPHCVVVETALGDAHGAAWGQALLYDEALLMTSDEPMLRAFTHAAYSVRREADGGDLASGQSWAQCAAQLPAEQLVYVAALAAGVPLVYGDRPKAVTYGRMLGLCSAAELDATFARQTEAEVRQLAGLPPPGGEDADAFERFCIRERDDIVAKALWEASAGAGAADVVGVVGADHLPGIAAAWSSAEALDISELLAAPEEPEHPFGMPPEEAQEAGVKRALLERVLGLRCTYEVLQDAQKALGEVPEEAFEAYDATFETYLSSRMRLASLSRDVLDASVGGVDKGSFWDALAYVRAIRPSEGGAGFDLAVRDSLRTLNYMM